MTTEALLVFDLLTTIAVAAAWVGVAALRMGHRARAATITVTAVAFALTALRVLLVLMLAQRGWPFAQEKVLLSLPLLLIPALAVALSALRPTAPHAAHQPAHAAAGGGSAADRTAGAAASWGGAYQTAGVAAGGGSAVDRTAGAAASGGEAYHAAAGGRGAADRAVVGAACGAVAGTVVAFTVGFAATVVSGLVVVVLAVAAFLLIAGYSRPVGVCLLVGALLAGPGWAAVSAFTTPLHGVDAAPLRLAAGTGAVSRFELTAGKLASGAWGFNGQTPGPVLRAQQGSIIEVVLRNTDIEEGVTLHWHGYPVPNGDDGVAGVTQEAVKPGGEFVYRFAAHKAGTFWYHTHQVSHRGVKKGLYGALIVEERPEPGEDVLVYAHRLVTGSATRPVVPGTQVRLRLINADDVTHRFLITGVAWRLSAMDGTDLAEPPPVAGQALRLAAGGRFDVRFTMPDGPVRLGVDGRPRLGLSAPAEAVNMNVPDLDLFTYGRPGPAAPRSFDREHTVVFDRQLRLLNGLPAYAYTVNGGAWPWAPSLTVREGELVKLIVVNRDREAHPMHPHGHQVLVLSRNGIAPSGSPLWTDSYEVLPGETWEVALRADNPGAWMAHCHNLQHAAEGMMLHLNYEGVATNFHHHGDNHPE